MKKQFRKIDIVVFAFTLMAILGMVLYLIIAWKTIPDQIPAKYTSAGEVLSYESKSTLLTFPIILLVMSVTLVIVSLFPTAWNVPNVKITPKNEPYIRVCVRSMIDIMLLLITIDMSVMFLYLANGKPMPIPLLIGLGVIFVGNAIFWIIRTIRVAKSVGE